MPLVGDPYLPIQTTNSHRKSKHINTKTTNRTLKLRNSMSFGDLPFAGRHLWKYT
jgi:hypothetical protein